MAKEIKKGERIAELQRTPEAVQNESKFHSLINMQLDWLMWSYKIWRLLNMSGLPEHYGRAVQAALLALVLCGMRWKFLKAKERMPSW